MGRFYIKENKKGGGGEVINKDLIINLGIVVVSLAAIGSLTTFLSHGNEGQELASHPVRVYERDIESEVFGVDQETDFVPGVYTGGLVVSPEEDYYNSLELMAKCVEAEAANQGLIGKRMVVDVILNRVNDTTDEWPDTIVDVITQPYQFTTYWNGAMDNVEEISVETWEAIFLELEEITYPDIYYFTNGDFHEYGTPWEKIGDHYFNKK